MLAEYVDFDQFIAEVMSPRVRPRKARVSFINRDEVVATSSWKAYIGPRYVKQQDHQLHLASTHSVFRETLEMGML